ncbi:MAG: low molecular weight phosphotyrosine protein phosphatase [Firmicutes bacterium]|nr:low molecular weight phosphotyrosine protein phosphatase [Bacillota bacterium]
MIKILFVCHGNICRSPMAEFVMKDMVKRKGLAEQVEISSAATSTEEIGNPVYLPARRTLSEHGIYCDGKTARRMTKGDYDYYDYIIAMDKNNIRNIERIVGEDKDHKISLLLSYSGIDRDISDPWYTGNFDATWNDVVKGCKGLLEHIENEI